MGEEKIVLFYRRVTGWLSNLANLAALATLAASIWALLSGDKSAPAITVSVLAVVLLIALVFMSYWWERRARLARYAAVTYYMESVAERARDARFRLSDSSDPKQIKSAYNADLQAMLTDIAALFSYATDRQCRAALKLLRPIAKKDKEPEDDAFVYVQARDKHSTGAFENSDAERFRLQFDRLSMNPHLRDLFSKKSDGEDWSCYNNIPKLICDVGYTSSSIAWWIQRGAGPSLPYASALVALVRGANGDSLGFVGVDCSHPSVFVPKTDGPLLVAMASYIGMLVELVEKNSTLTEAADSPQS